MSVAAAAAAATSPPPPSIPAQADLRVTFGDGLTHRMLWFVGDQGALVTPANVQPVPTVRVCPVGDDHAEDALFDEARRYTLTLSSSAVRFNNVCVCVCVCVCALCVCVCACVWVRVRPPREWTATGRPVWTRPWSMHATEFVRCILRTYIYR